MDHARRAYRTLLPLLCIGQLWACSSDAGTGGVGVDADVIDPADADLTVIELDAGMGLSFAPSPGIGVSFDHDGASVELEEIQLFISDLRLIGDAATGDNRTSKESVKLQWDEDVPGKIMIAYESAPPGMYSHVRGTVTRLEIGAEVSGSGVGDFKLEVEDEFQNGGFELDLDYTLEAGAPVVVEISIDFESIISVLDFDSLEVEEGTVELSGDALDDMVGALPAAFGVKDLR